MGKRLTLDALLSMPSIDGGPEWFGTVNFTGESGSSIEFELARRDPPPKSMMMSLTDKAPNIDTNLANVCFDLQLEGCLGFPKTEIFDPLGASGGLVKWPRQFVKGKASYLLVGDNSDFFVNPCVPAMTLRSFGLETIFAKETSELSDSAVDTKISEFKMDGLGLLTVHVSQTSSHSMQEKRETRYPILEFEFQKDLSGLQAVRVAQLFDQAFSLLCGIRFKLLPISLQRSGFNRFFDRKVHVGDQNWKLDRYWLEALCIVENEDLENLFNALGQDMEGFSRDIGVLFDCLETFKFSEDILFWAMPLMERLLHEDIVTAKEKSFKHLEKSFYEFLDKEAPQEIMEFSKKHLVVKDRKNPSTKLLIEQAITEFENDGVSFPENAAKIVWKVRNKLMHGGMSDISDEEVHLAADFSRTLSYMMVLRRLKINPPKYRERLTMISSTCGGAASPK